MSVDMDELRKRGISSGQFKKIFTADSLPPRVEKLVRTIQQRIHDGRQSNLREYRTYWAIDLAHEAPFAQTTPTIVQALMSRNLKADDLLKELETLGLSERELFLDIDVGNGVTKKLVNPPVFFRILLPIVRAYNTIRTARIYNERDTSPLFKFSPAKQTDANRVKCEIITDIVDTTSQWYGYQEYLKQAIQQMLRYGIVLGFPKEEWHYEMQVVDGEEAVQKEGLRYVLPHPTRMGWDLHHPLPTINTDTGVEYAFHWDVVRYGDILDNRKYWNRKAISFGTNWMDQPLYRNYFNEVFPCQLKFPAVNDPNVRREDKAAYYGTSERDSALFITQFFWKIVPANWGLGDYKFPVWHRFVVASDNCIIWAEPCAYNPIWFMGYDFDAQAGQPSSFSLECIPHQDHLGNLLSQMVLTAKQNLDNPIFYDTNLVQEKHIKQMENLGERRYRSRQFIPFDSLKLAKMGLDKREAFHTPSFQPRNIVELQSMMNTWINVMERLLGITAQESGAAASHYQSAEEIRSTGGASSDRLRYTASSVDSGIDAWSQQLYEANMAYRDDDVEAHVTKDIKDLEKILEDIGFKLVGDGPTKRLVGGKKSKLTLVEFARKNVPAGQQREPQMATSIFQSLAQISANPEFVQIVGPKRVLKLLEQATKFAGGPDDFDLLSDNGEQQSQALGPDLLKELMPILQKLQQSILQTVDSKIAQPMAQINDQQTQQIQQIGAVIQKLEGQFQANGMDSAKLQMAQTELNQKMQLRQREFEAEQARIQQQHELDMRMKASKAGLDASLKSQETAADIELKKSAAAKKLPQAAV